MSKRLPNIPISLPGESALSVLIRAASENGWTPMTLGAAIGFRSPNEFVPFAHRREGFRRLSNRLGFVWTDVLSAATERASSLKGSAFVWYGMQVPSQDLHHVSTPVCTACLSSDEVPYLRSLWSHRYAESCLIHGHTLVTDCFRCHQPLHFNRPSVSTCKCGQDLRDARPEAVDPIDARLVGEAISTGNPGLLRAALEVKSIFQAVHTASSEPPSASVSARRAAALLERPESVGSMLSSSGPDRISPRVLFRSLNAFGAESYFEALLEACETRGLTSISGTFGQLLVGACTAAEAARVLGVSDRIIQRLSEAGLLTTGALNPEVPDGPMGLTISSINNTLLAFLKHQAPAEWTQTRRRSIPGTSLPSAFKDVASGKAVADGYGLIRGFRSLQFVYPERPPIPRVASVPLTELALRAGVHYESVRFLIRASVLEATLAPSGRRTWLVSSSAADEFIDTYVFAGPLARSVQANPTNFAEKLMAHGVRPVSGPRIDGGLSYLFRRADLAELDMDTVSKTSGYDTCTGRRRERVIVAPPDSVSLKDAADILAISVGIATQLLAEGVLHSAASSRRARFVTLASLNELKAKLEDPALISLNDAQAAVSESKAAFRRRWLCTGFISIVMVSRWRLVKRSDLDRIIAAKKTYRLGAEFCQQSGLQRTHFNNQVKVQKSFSVLSAGPGPLHLHLFEPNLAEAEILRATDGAQMPPTMMNKLTNFAGV